MWEFIIYVGIGFAFFKYAVPMFRKKFIKKNKFVQFVKVDILKIYLVVLIVMVKN